MRAGELFATGAGIRSLIVIFVRCCECALQVFARAGAGIDEATIAQRAPGCEVKLAALTLRIWCEEPTDIRAFVPIETQPVQVFIHGVYKVRLAALEVEVFVAKDETAVGGSGTLVRDPECARVSQMEVAGRRGGKSSAIRECHDRLQMSRLRNTRSASVS